MKNKVLTSKDVIFIYPNYKESFDLKTDALATCLGSVLLQEGKSVIMLSRTRRGPEINFATNERKVLCNSMGPKIIESIYRDHQPMVYSASEKTNAKKTRWNAFIDKHNANMDYKPGKQNHVSDALSLPITWK